MEVTALCTRLLMDVLVLLAAQVHHSYFAQKADAAFPRITPDRLQFFDYETVSINCEEFSSPTEWRVMRKLNKIIPTNSFNWSSSAPSCTIYPAFERHSGEYWCEDAEGNTSGAVNITVTAGSVILEVPARPVVEGHDVILQCRNKKSQSKHIADFYKDGVQLGTWYESHMTIHKVSKSDEGLYKCRISEAGESAESWLAVLSQSKGAYEEIRPPHHHSPDLLSLLWIVVSVLLVALLLVVVVLLCRKHRVSVCFSSRKPTPRSHLQENHTDSGEDVDPHHAAYAVVRKQRKEKVSVGDSVDDSNNVTYAVVKSQRKKKEPEVSRAGSKPHLPEENVVYSSVNHRPLPPD